MNKAAIIEGIRQLKADAQHLIEKATQLETDGLGLLDSQAPRKGLSKTQRAVKEALLKRERKFRRLEEKSLDK